MLFWVKTKKSSNSPKLRKLYICAQTVFLLIMRGKNLFFETNAKVYITLQNMKHCICVINAHTVVHFYHCAFSIYIFYRFFYWKGNVSVLTSHYPQHNILFLKYFYFRLFKLFTTFRPIPIWPSYIAGNSWNYFKSIQIFFMTLLLLLATVSNHLFAAIPLSNRMLVIVLSAHICFGCDIASIMQPPKSQTFVKVEKVTFTTYRYICFCLQKCIK